MKKIVLLAAMVLFAGTVFAIESQPLSFEGFNDIKQGNLINWLTGQSTLYYDGIQFDANDTGIILIWQQSLSAEEQQWVPGNKTTGKDIQNIQDSNEIFILSSLMWATAINQNTTVTNLILTDESDQNHLYEIKAGIHTAEWSLNSSPLHSRPESVLGPSSNPNWNGKLYIARIPLGSTYTPKYIYMEYINPGTNGGAIGIEAITFNKVEAEPQIPDNNFDERITALEERVAELENQNQSQQNQINTLTETLNSLQTIINEIVNFLKNELPKGLQWG